MIKRHLNVTAVAEPAVEVPNARKDRCHERPLRLDFAVTEQQPGVPVAEIAGQAHVGMTLDHLHLGRGAAAVRGEVAVRTHGLTRWRRTMYGLNVRAQQLIGRFLMHTRLRFVGVSWGTYKDEVIANTDRRKFDDTLRIVLSGTAAERQAMEAWLEERYRAGVLAYGLHVAPAALMTCLIGDRAAGDHVHFVDGANGGYAMAAVDLKRRLGEPRTRA